jgi:integrase
LIHVPQDPTAGIRQVPSRPPGVRILPRDARLYEAVLHSAKLNARDHAILILLAMGLTPADVAGLRMEDLDLTLRLVKVGHGRRRTLPLSDNVVACLSRYVATASADPCPFLFPGVRQRLRLSASAIRAVVRHAAAVTFPRPEQESARAKINASGFRNVYIRRLVRARISPTCFRELTGVDRFSRLEPFLPSAAPAKLHRVLARVLSKWPGWI